MAAEIYLSGTMCYCSQQAAFTHLYFVIRLGNGISDLRIQRSSYNEVVGGVWSLSDRLNGCAETKPSLTRVLALRHQTCSSVSRYEDPLKHYRCVPRRFWPLLICHGDCMRAIRNALVPVMHTVGVRPIYFKWEGREWIWLTFLRMGTYSR